MTGPKKPIGRAIRRPADVHAPQHWTRSQAPAPAAADRDRPDPLGIDPVRYGDWERNGIAIDF